jgi:CheY-like chemotaxis protein
MGHPILLVEDDDDIRVAVAMLLRTEGYSVFEAENGQVGLDLLKKMPRPCVILLDMMMPVLDGRGFLQLLQSNELLVSIPVVVVSAHDIPDTAKSFLRKPFDVEALVKIVRNHCAQPGMS